jgi:septal ring factor EnvC (AmiA/AmiB activator)
MTAALAAAVALAGPVPAAAAGPAETLAGTEARVAAATAAAVAGGAGVAALAAALADHERALAALRDEVLGAEARQRALSADLTRRRTEIARLLAALQSLGRTPSPEAHPGGPLAAARSERLHDAMRPALAAKADRLAAQLRDLAAVRASRAEGAAVLEAGLGRLAAGRDALTAALEAGPAAGAAPGLAARGLPADVARDADTLSGLADRLAALGGATGPADAAPLPLVWPVVGRTRSAFGDPDGAGVRRPGLLIEAAPLAIVTAPAAGTVRYAGPFLDYGYVAVIEVREDVLIVLAGLATLSARTGDRLAAGDFVGLLGGRQVSAQEFLMLPGSGNGETPAETLYIELRHGHGPVDPAPWFAERN